MTIVARPIGPGNWTPMTLTYRGKQTAPFLAVVGERFTVAGVTWRVVEVRA
jgi:hypothetical protein